MHIISINIGAVRNIEFSGEQVATGIFKTPVCQKIQAGRLGLNGDEIADASVHGGQNQAVYLYSEEDYDWWSDELGRRLVPSEFGENLTTRGLDLRTLIIGDRLQFEHENSGDEMSEA